MNASSDPQLLREFAGRRSEAAFAELVRRHIDFVHSTASRLTNDPHLAKDVSQGDFVALSKEAGKLARHPVLTGWLHRTTRNIAAHSIRTEVRRRHREQEAAAMHALPDAEPSWDEVSPVLDAALADLSESDRDAVLLRYFENKPAHEMAAILGIGTEAAQKRVSRAVERLRDNFARRGITAGTAGLASIISTHAVQAAPAGLAASVSSVAIAGVSATAKLIVSNLLRKLAFGTAVAAAIAVAVRQSDRASALEEENQVLQQRLATPSARTGSSAPSVGLSAVVNDGTPETVPAASVETAGATDGSPAFGVYAFIGESTDPKDFSLFAPGGRGVTTGAAEFAGLDALQRKAVDKIIRNAWKRMEQDFASRAVETQAQDTKVKAYSIPARADGGHGPRRQLEGELDEAVGAEKRKLLMGGIGSSGFFGGFGALTVRLEFQSDLCRYWVTDPKSGKQEVNGSMDSEDFADEFGVSFEFPAQEDGPASSR